MVDVDSAGISFLLLLPNHCSIISILNSIQESSACIASLEHFLNVVLQYADILFGPFKYYLCQKC